MTNRRQFFSSMDQTDGVTNTETTTNHEVDIANDENHDAHHSLIDSANEFAFSIENQQQ